MQLVSGTSVGLPPGLYSRVSRYRHEVFIQRLGWNLQTPDGVEVDQFDREDTVYVVAQDDDGNIAGCGRLLPTTRPYLLSEIFPQLMNGAPPPSSPAVWELSRFCAVDLNAKLSGPLSQMVSPVAIKIVRAALECAAGMGANQLITVSPVGIERLIRRAGLRSHRAGPPVVIDGHALFACLIDVAAN